MRDIKIISITYSLELTEEVYEKAWKADVLRSETLCDKLEKVLEIKSMGYLIEPTNKKIRITFLTDSIKKVDPKYNNELWQRIASIINEHIKEEEQ